MNLFPILLTLATLGCALVTGITLIFAIVIMPGLGSLGDRAFLEGFKAIDQVIQNNHPVFILVWLGSALTLIIATGLGLGELANPDCMLLVAALVLYLGGVQIPTAAVNVPLNNQLQVLQIDELNDDELRQARTAFEPRWLTWNTLRTWLALITTVLLLILLLRW